MIRLQMTRIIALWMAGLLFAAQPCMAMVVGYCRASGSAWTTILSDGFDGDLSLWTSETDVNIIGAVSGSAYVVTMAAPAQVAYLNKTFASPAPYAHVWWDFYASLSDVTAVGNAAGQSLRLIQGGNGNNDTAMTVGARCATSTGDLDQLIFGYHDGTSPKIDYITFPWNAEQVYHVVAEYYSADGGAGYAKLWVDGNLISNVTGLSNSARTFDRTKYGVAFNNLAGARLTVTHCGVVYARQ